MDFPTLAEGQIVGNGDVRAVSYGQDSGLYVEFRMEDEYQSFASAEQGKPVYKQVPYVKMHVPGDKTKVIDRPAFLEARGDIPSDPHRFPQQWAAFKAGEQAVTEGMPLKEWTKVTASQVRDMNAMHIHTVEQLAAVHDGSLDGLGHGGRFLRDQAKAWLEAANDGGVSKLVADNARLEADLAAMKATIESMNKSGRAKQNADA